MSVTIEAVYEGGVFKPLRDVLLSEGQRVTISVRPSVSAVREVDEELRAWQKVYEGLSQEDVAGIEQIALDRSNFMRAAPAAGR